MVRDVDYSKIGAWVDGTYAPVDKLHVHQMGFKHRAVSVFLVRGSEVLLQKRAYSKYHTPGLWANTCCTHPLWGEKPEDCAVRRLYEELGITDITPRYRHALEYRAEVGNGLIEHEVVDIFVAQLIGNIELCLNPEEVAETQWLSIVNLEAEISEHPERYTPWLKIYMEDAHRRIVLEK